MLQGKKKKKKSVPSLCQAKPTSCPTKNNPPADRHKLAKTRLPFDFHFCSLSKMVRHDLLYASSSLTQKSPEREEPSHGGGWGGVWGGNGKPRGCIGVLRGRMHTGGTRMGESPRIGVVEV